LMRRAQANVIAVVIMAGVAVAIGVGILTYIHSLTSIYTSNLQRDRMLNHEMFEDVVQLIAVDPNNHYVWLLFRRLDNASVNFYAFMVFHNATSTYFIPCSSVLYFVPSKDTNGILCDPVDNDCLPAPQLISVRPSYIMINPGYGWVPLSVYSKVSGIVPPTSVSICRIPYEGGNRIVRVSVPSIHGYLYIYLVAPWSHSYYVFKVVRVPLS